MKSQVKNTSRYPAQSLVASEIAQQPASWPDTLARVASAGIKFDLKNSAVVLTGAGTSAYAAQAIADAWPGARSIATTDLLVQSAKELLDRAPQFAKSGVLISLARSGDSPESVAVVERITKLFPAVKHIAIVCNATGRLARLPSVMAICLEDRTNDRSLAMTSSFSNLALAGLCLLHADAIAATLPAICERLHERFDELNALAEQIALGCDDRIVILASGMRALTGEAALKIVELTRGRVFAMPETFLGLRHGPVTFMRAHTPIVCFASSDATRRLYEKDLLEDLRSRGLGRIVLVGDDVAGWENDILIPAGAGGLPDALRTPFEIPCMQLLAYQLSVHAGVDPDNPSPDGTVTRVVRPFRIHGGDANA